MSAKPVTQKALSTLKQLREEHLETVAKAQTIVKHNNTIQRKILKSMGAEAKTVPQLAGEVGLPSQDILWQITAMKKYDRVVEAGMDGEYFLYRTSKEAK